MVIVEGVTGCNTQPQTITIDNEIRDLPPVNGWRVTEPTGRVSAACTCGRRTGGYVDRSDFNARAWREHAGI